MPSISEPETSTYQYEPNVPLSLRGNDTVGGKYKLSHVLDFGSSGEVWKAYIADQGASVALKVIRTPGYSQRATRALEVANIISKAGSNRKELFADVVDSGIISRHRYLVFPLLGISLGMLLGRYPQSSLLSYQKNGILLQIAQGIEFLHSMCIVHTDLKPDNVILVDNTMDSVFRMDKDGRVYEETIPRDIRIKIIDLEDSKNLTAKRTSCIGTFGYTAPEVYCGIGWGFAVDIFAFGCIMYEVQFYQRFLPDITGIDVMFAYLERSVCLFRAPLVKEIREHFPFLFDDSIKSPRVILRGEDIHFVRSEVRNLKGTMRSLVSDGSFDFKDLMRKCLNVDARQRPTALECVRHKYFRLSNVGDTLALLAS